MAEGGEWGTHEAEGQGQKEKDGTESMMQSARRTGMWRGSSSRTSSSGTRREVGFGPSSVLSQSFERCWPGSSLCSVNELTGILCFQIHH